MSLSGGMGMVCVGGWAGCDGMIIMFCCGVLLVLGMMMYWG